MFVHILGTAGGIILGGIAFLAGWCILEGPGARRRANAPKYWVCTAGHHHQTPDASRKCTAAQTRARARW